MVWILQACHTGFVRRHRWLRPSTAARHPAQAGQAPPASDDAKPTTGNGPTPSSRIAGCSPFTLPTCTRDIPDEETNDWRAVCGKTARTVRRAGRPHLPDPYRITPGG